MWSPHKDRKTNDCVRVWGRSGVDDSASRGSCSISVSPAAFTDRSYICLPQQNGSCFESHRAVVGWQWVQSELFEGQYNSKAARCVLNRVWLSFPTYYWDRNALAHDAVSLLTQIPPHSCSTLATNSIYPSTKIDTLSNIYFEGKRRVSVYLSGASIFATSWLCLKLRRSWCKRGTCTAPREPVRRLVKAAGFLRAAEPLFSSYQRHCVSESPGSRTPRTAVTRQDCLNSPTPCFLLEVRPTWMW